MKLDRSDTPTGAEYGTVYVAFELSKAKWKLGIVVPGSEKMSRFTITGGDLAALAARLSAARAKAERHCEAVRIVSCYEAGFDGHWLHRWLLEHGVVNRGELRVAAPGSNAGKVVQLAGLKGIGVAGGQKLVNEVFYKKFDNRRQVGSYLGMVGTPYDSGETRREQGISKAGNHRARATAIELAWLWLTHQPDSELSRWFRARVGDIKGRIRRITI